MDTLQRHSDRGNETEKAGSSTCELNSRHIEILSRETFHIGTYLFPDHVGLDETVR